MKPHALAAGVHAAVARARAVAVTFREARGLLLVVVERCAARWRVVLVALRHVIRRRVVRVKWEEPGARRGIVHFFPYARKPRERFNYVAVAGRAKAELEEKIVKRSDKENVHGR